MQRQSGIYPIALYLIFMQWAVMFNTNFSSKTFMQFLAVFFTVLFNLALPGVNLPAYATPYTTTVPGTTGSIPANYPEAGGIVVVLEGINGNVYYQFSNPSVMFVGFQNTGTPSAWQGNPFQIAPTQPMDCGVTSCNTYLGGTIVRAHIRFTAYDGDTQPGGFDENDITLRLNGFDVSNWSGVYTQNTNLAGTVLNSSGTGFGNNTFDTAWFTTTDSALLSNILTTGQITSTVFDADPNDNYWDFTRGNDADTSTVPVTVAPGMTVDKSTTTTTYSTIGQVINYTYVITNIGSVFIDNIQGTDDKLPGTNNINCPQTLLNPSQSMTCTASYTVTAADLNNPSIDNTVTITGTPQAGALGSVSDTVSIPVTPLPSWTFSKSSSSTPLNAGDIATYSFQLANTGNTSITSVNIADAKCDASPVIVSGDSAPLNSLDAGETWVLSCDHTVTQAEIDTGIINNNATATGLPSGGTLPALNASDTINIAANPAWTLSKNTPSTPTAAGDIVNYNFQLSNTGNITINTVNFSDAQCDAPPTLVSGNNAPSISLDPGEVWNYTCAHTVTQAEVDAGSINNTATATGLAVRGTLANTQGSNTIAIAPAPSMEVIKTGTLDMGGDGIANAGDVINYSFAVSNTGNVTLNNVVITDANATMSGGPLASLAPGASDIVTFSAIYTLTQSDIDTGEFSNSATATADTPGGGTISDISDSSNAADDTGGGSDPTTTPIPRSPSFTMVKNVTSSNFTNVGDIVSYEYIVTNAGNVTMTSPITISDNRIILPNTVTCPPLPVGGLVPGANITCTADYVVTQNDLDIGSITNVATATDGTTTSPPDSATTPANVSPALTLTKSSPTASYAAVGDIVDYSYNVENTGNISLTGDIDIIDDKIGTFLCGNQNLAPAQTITCTAQYTITQADIDAGSVTNQANAINDFNGTPVTSPNSAVSVPAVLTTSLSVAKSSPDTSFANVGQILTYSYLVTNTGNTTIINPITVVDDKITTPNTVTCPPLPVGGLLPLATQTCNASYVVTQADLDSGAITNTAIASSGSTSSAPVTLTINASLSPSIISTKSSSYSDTNLDGIVNAGDQITFGYLVTNNGNLSLGSVTIAETGFSGTGTPPVPAFVSATQGSGPGTLLPSESATYQAVYTLTQADIDAGSLSNQATVSGTPPTGPAVTDQTDSTNAGDDTGGGNDPTTLALAPAPSMDVIKSGTLDLGGDGIASIGDVISYTFTVVNTGNVTLSNITISDPSANMSGGPIASLAPGMSDTATFTASHVLTQSDIDAGTYSNTATASAGIPGGGAITDTSDSGNPADDTGGNSDPTVIVVPQSPSMDMVKNATSVNFTSVGDQVNYEYVVTNTGNTTITNPITITDNRIAANDITCPAFPPAGIAPGANYTCTAIYTVTQADLDVGSLTNVATASDGTTTSLPTDETVPGIISPGLTLAKSSAATGYSAVGELLTYDYVITNTGNITLTGDFNVVDDKIGTFVCAFTNVLPGETISCSAQYTVTQADLDAGSLTNQAYATNDQNGSQITSAIDAVTISANQTSSLSIAKSSPDASYSTPGQVLSYAYVVTNTGNVTITNPITVTDDRIISPNTVNCTPLPLNGLAPSQSISCTALYSVTQQDIDAGTITNTATATDGATVSPPAALTINATQSSTIVVQKSSSYIDINSDNIVNAGDQLVYNYTATNTGNVSLSAVTITENGFSGSGTMPVPVFQSANLGSPQGVLLPTETANWTASYILTQADIDAGIVNNQAIVNATPPGGGTISDISDSVNVGDDTGSGDDVTTSTLAPAPSMELIKSGVLDLGSDAIAGVGDIINYTFTITNTGNVTLSNISLSDASATMNGGPVLSLAPGSSDTTTFTATYVLTQSDIDNGSFTNTATATASIPGGGTITDISDSANAADDSSGDADPTTTIIPQAPAFTMVKNVVASSFTNVGDSVDYEYIVTNSGNTTITSPITVSDNRIITPNAVTCPSLPVGGLAPASSLTCTATYIVTQNDLDVGSVTNVASATDGTITSPSDSATTPANILPALSVTKSSPHTSYASVGDVVDYDYQISNTGNITLTGTFNIIDDKIGTIACATINLTPSASVSCSAQYTVTQADIDAGSLTNEAYATNDLNGTTVTSAITSLTIPASQTPALTIVKSSPDTSFATPGQILSYAYVVTNSGNTTITVPVSVSDDKIISPNSVNCPALPIGGLAPNASINCSASYTVTQSDLDAGSLTNVAIASAGALASPSASLTINAAQSPSLVSTKASAYVDTNSDNITNAGDQIIYSYRVTNNGNVTLSSVSLNETGFTGSGPTPVPGFISADFASPPGTLVPGETALYQASYTLTQADVDAGIVSNQATINGTPPSGPVVSDLTDSTNPGDDTGGDSDITRTSLSAAPALEVIKTSVLNLGGNGIADAGDTITYAFSVSNTGNVTLSNIAISDPSVTVNGGPVLTLAPGASDNSTFSAIYTLTQVDIDNGSVSNTATGTASIPGGGTISDVSDSGNAGDDTGGNSDVTTTALPQMPSMSAVKTATNINFTNVGDVVDYSYTITNTGNVTISSPLSVSDNRIASANINCPALPVGGLAPGASHICTSQYTITQADLDVGSVTNVATISDGTTITDPVDETIPANTLPALTVTKTSPDTSYSSAGDILTYNYLVENTGNITLTGGVDIVDNKIGTIACTTANLAPTATVSCSATYSVTQADLDMGFVTNQAYAINDLNGSQITSPIDTVTINAVQTPALTTNKTSPNTSYSVPGEVLTYSYEITNSGNVTIVDPVSVSDDRILAPNQVICPPLPSGGLSPNVSIFCSASYVVTQADIDAGSLTNIASATDGTIVSPTDSVTINAARDTTIAFTKTASNPVQVFGPIYDVTYTLDATNRGNVTQNNVLISDDIASFLAPSTLVSIQNITISGFSGGATANAAYDGAAISALLNAGAVLAPGATGTITITARFDISAGSPASGNTALLSSDVIAPSQPSDDPTQTPGNPNDINPTPLSVIDTDGDGSPDGSESTIADRDGDGVADASDYDPTGYFYCEENGQILTGGGITIVGPAGSNSAIGTANNITIVQDGSNGFYQFYVSVPGTYQIVPTYPASGVASTLRLPNAGSLDVTSLLPSNPGVLGSSEFGATGVLADFTAAANQPYYFSMDIEAGDPTIFSNNIPLKFCATPQLTATKSIIGTPTLAPSGATRITYRLSAENSGLTQVNDVTLIDDLDAVFGAGNYTISSHTIQSAPAGFGAISNAAYDGSTNTNLLSSGGILQPGESVSVDLVVDAMPSASGTFTNNLAAGGSSPLTSLPIATANSNVDVTLVAASDLTGLQVTKTANRNVVRIGEAVSYTISITNPDTLARNGVNIVDLMPAGFVYLPGSSLLAGNPVEPTLTGRRLVWTNQNIAAGATVVITLTMRVSAAAAAAEFTNSAFMEDPATGNLISTIGRATVRREVEHVFDCGEIIGKVFNDTNRNGYHNKGEKGLPGVRLATVKGLLITTDKHGRFSVPCAAIPDAEIGSNFILKLDRRTLPAGYYLTTENPRAVRLTRGKLTKMNFGASPARVVRIDLAANAFVKGTTRPNKNLHRGIGQLIGLLDGEISILRLNYRAISKKDKLAKRRLAAIRKLIADRWVQNNGRYKLQIQTTITTGR